MSSSQLGRSQPQVIYTPPKWEPSQRQELEQVSLEKSGLTLDQQALIKEYVKLCEQTEADSCLVLHRGKLVARNYWRNTDENFAASVMSSTKSAVSILFGIMKDRGLVDETEYVSAYIPAWIDHLSDPIEIERKAQVTLKHLLTFTAGYPVISGKDNQHKRLVFTSEPKNAFAERQVPEFTPGTQGIYCNRGVQLLGAVMARVCKEKFDCSLQAFAQQVLFQPLGMHPATHFAQQAGSGDVLVFAQMKILPEDFIKLGELMRNRGQWNGESIVSQDWVRASTTQQSMVVEIPGSDPIPHGYLWWPDLTSGGFSSHGLVDNQMHVIPQSELILLRTEYLRTSDEEAFRYLKQKAQRVPNYKPNADKILQGLAGTGVS